MEIEDFIDMLDEISGDIPRAFFKELNGGIVLRPEKKYHPAGIKNDLYIMGEYHVDPRMGRSIFIYYGSFAAIYGYLKRDMLRERVKKTVLHEFTHHFESLAGEKDLEIEDAVKLVKYKQQHLPKES